MLKPSLFAISKQAKSNPDLASKAILIFVKEKFPSLLAQKIKINNSKTSLNSVNGFIYAAGKPKYFFKFHSEEGEEKTLNQGEYYQGRILEKNGWPMLKAIYENADPGSQFLIYPFVNAPTAFQEFEKLEKKPDAKLKKNLLAAEKKLLAQEAKAMLASLEISKAKDLALSPIHQLFYTRLVSKNKAKPRLDIFYTGRKLALPNKKIISFNELAKKKWIINGIEYAESLEEIISKAKNILNPLKEKKIASVIAHGDDHNGNKFYLGKNFILFDPAFAGRHPALLSFVKATFHNTFAHPFWLYDPGKLKSFGLELVFETTKNKIIISHNWEMAKQSPVRQKILDLQIKKVWQPLIAELKKQKALPKYYIEYIRKALFCCPFLVYNLIDYTKYSPLASLLALSKSVELGSSGNKESYVDRFLNKL